MKLTSRRLKKVVKEEVQKFLGERDQTMFVIKDRDSGWYVTGDTDIGMTGWVEDVEDAASWPSKEKAEYFVRKSEAVSRTDTEVVPKEAEVPDKDPVVDI